MITKAQAKERLNFIGSSDAPIITGHSPFMSAYELYLIKRREIEPRPGNERADIGNFLEDGIGKIFTNRTGIKLQKVKETIYHPEFDYIACNLDRVVKGKNIIAEIKNTAVPDEWGYEEDGAESIPVSVHVQVQHQMACFGSDMAIVVVLLFGSTLKIYEVPRDQDIIDGLLQKELAFWDCVRNGTPPAVEYNHSTTNDLLKRVYRGTNGEKIQLPDESQMWHQWKIKCDGIAKENKAHSATFEAKIREAMGENAVGVLPDGTCYTRRADKNGKIRLNHSKYVPGDK